jgi:hypothetical protein
MHIAALTQNAMCRELRFPVCAADAGAKMGCSWLTIGCDLSGTIRVSRASSRLISHAQNPFLFSNLYVFWVLSENLEAAVKHLTMEILLNLSS